MAQYSFIKISNGSLVSASRPAREFMHVKIKCGGVLSADFKKDRDSRRHRNYSAILNLGDKYWQPIGDNTPIDKFFNALRYWLVEQLSHYETFEMSDGSLRRITQLISFTKMNDLAFGELYKATLDVLWNCILFRKIPTQQVAENVAAQLLDFI
ncbi:DUF1367 family protein [Providencia huaxiensis]